MLITNSRLRAFRRCPRYHQHAYVDLVRPVEQSYALRFGTLIHLGLEHYWKADTFKLSAAFSAMRAAESDEFELVKAEELLRGYSIRWADDGWETIAVEKEFSVPLVHPATGEVFPARLGGKLDALARKDGRVYIPEHKTSSEDISPGSVYWQKLTLDSQVSTYLQAAKEMGYSDVAGVLYDVLLRPPMEPKKATPEESRKYTKATKTQPSRLYANQRDTDESLEEYRIRLREDIASDPDCYYQRGTVVRTESEEREAAFDLWHWSEAVLRGGYAPRNTEQCRTVYGTCPYLSVCTGVDSLDNVLKFRRSERENEELSA
jgi:hypothetical protein